MSTSQRCVCVCARERERGGEGERERQKERNCVRVRARMLWHDYVSLLTASASAAFHASSASSLSSRCSSSNSRLIWSFRSICSSLYIFQPSRGYGGGTS